MESDNLPKYTLSRDILRQVVAILSLKGGHENDCSTIKNQFIKPSKRLGQPIVVSVEEYEALDRLYKLALEQEGTLRKEGDMLISVESQRQQPLVTGDSMHQSTPSSVHGQANERQLPPQSNKAVVFQVNNDVGSLQGSQSIGDDQSVGSFDSCQPEVSPATSSPRNGPASPRDKSDGSLPLIMAAEQRTMPVEKRQLKHHKHNKPESTPSDTSPPLQTTNTTVTFEATITTIDGITFKVPFGFHNITKTLEDIAAFVDWKNSAGGMHCNVDFNSFTSIRKFTSESSSALVVRRSLDE